MLSFEKKSGGNHPRKGAFNHKHMHVLAEIDNLRMYEVFIFLLDNEYKNFRGSLKSLGLRNVSFYLSIALSYIILTEQILTHHVKYRRFQGLILVPSEI